MLSSLPSSAAETLLLLDDFDPGNAELPPFPCFVPFPLPLARVFPLGGDAPPPPPFDSNRDEVVAGVVFFVGFIAANCPRRNKLAS